MKTKSIAVLLTVALLAGGVVPARYASGQVAKTRIMDRILDPSGNPRQGKVTFILTRKVSSPAGIIPVAATVSASLDSSGRFDISVFPSATLTPTTYYQVWFADSSGATELIGVYHIPVVPSVISLSAYKLTDTNLAAEYTFASVADVTSLVSEVSTATVARLNGVTHVNGKVEAYKSASGTFEDPGITDNGSTVTIDRPTIINSSLTAGAVNATSLTGNSAGITGLAGTTGGVANTSLTTIRADTDANRVGKISLQTGGIERIGVEADRIIKFGGTVSATSGTGDAGAKIVAAITACPATGCVVDARGMTGTISQDMFSGVTKPITLLLGVGTYVVTVQQTYATSTSTQGLRIIGAGKYATIIDNQVANGAAFKLDGSNGGAALDVYQRGTELRDFSIITTTNPASSRGIDIRSNMNPTMSGVRIQGLSSHGIQLLNEDGDHDASAYLIMSNCELLSNGGWGFYTANPVTSNGSGSFLFLNDAIVRNGAGGVRAIGLNWSFKGGSITYNTGYGLYVPYTTGRVSQTFQLLQISDTEMDGNTISHVFLEAAVSASFDRVKAITSEGQTPGVFAPTTAFKIGVNGGRGSVIATKLNSTILRRDGGRVTLFQIANNASNTLIDEFTTNTSTGVTNWTNAGTATRIIKDGKLYGGADSTISTTETGTSYTPDGMIAIQRIVIKGTTGTFTINAPTNPEDGQELDIILQNLTASSVALNAVFVASGFVSPTAGQRTSARFRYVAAASSWIQIGAWSPPA
jgi:hypothetical protein